MRLARLAHRILRERLTWAILAALVVALCVGARTGAVRVEAERAALARAGSSP
jgi:ABC-2 type transport system permease protein